MASVVVGGRTGRSIIVGLVLFAVALLLGVTKRTLLVIESGLIKLFVMLGHRSLLQVGVRAR